MLKIGDFSRLARVSIKTLRFYDAAGLFVPARVEPRTGYRLYSAGQLPQLRRALLLRELGCSVAEAASLLELAADSPEYRACLARLRRRLMVRVARDEAQLRRLDALLRAHQRAVADPAAAGPPVEERALAAVSVLALRERLRSLDEVQQMFEAAEQRVARHGCRARRSPFLLFHDMEYRDSQVDVEVCVPVEAAALGVCGGCLVPAVERAACVRFSGGYEQAPALYEWLLGWMDRSAMRIAGPIRETYVRFGADQVGYTLPAGLLAGSPADYETELQIPLAPL